MPRRNVKNLMLRREVVEAVEAGRFHVWAVSTVDEALELLTGRPAGERRRMLRGTSAGGKSEFPQENERSCYFSAVGKGETTREAILRHAVGLASRVGLSGLSIGRLAQEPPRPS